MYDRRKSIYRKHRKFSKVKVTAEIEGKSIELVREILALLKFLEKEHKLELMFALEKMYMEDKINEKA